MTGKWIVGRNVILSGCSTGIGREICRQLVLKYSCNVIGIARNKEKLDSLKAELGDKFTYRRFDISKREAWAQFAEDLKELNFKVDILINNAGMIQPFTQYADLSQEQIDKINKTNYESILSSCSILIPQIKESHYGSIVNISSASALLPVAGESIYSASKCAVRGLTEALYQELKVFGIHVECVMPGPVRTDIYKARESEGEQGSKVKDSLIENIGLTAERAATKIISTIKRRKFRVALGFIAKLMDFGMRCVPRFTCACTSFAIRKLGKKVQSFAPIFDEYRITKEAIAKNKKERKNYKYKKNTAPIIVSFKNDSKMK